MVTFDFWLLLTVVLLYAPGRPSETARRDAQVQRLLQKASTIAVNKILENYAANSVQSTEDVKLSDVVKGDSSEFFGLIKSNVEAKNGRLTYTRKPQIQGDVKAVRNPELGILIDVSLSFEGIKAVYDNFTLFLSLVGEKHGILEAATEENVFDVSIRVSTKPHCKAELNDVNVQTFGRLEPTVTGMGYKLMDSVAASIIKKFLAEVQTKSQSVILSTLKQALREAIKSTDVCSILVGGYLLTP